MRPSTLMAVYALVLTVLAGTTGAWWTVLVPVPHMLAWVYLR